jgi:succinate dehydrogenase/fumarate reductase flavoprotein subunit
VQAQRLAAQTLQPGSRAGAFNSAALVESLQQLLARKVGPFRTGPALAEALDELSALRAEIAMPPAQALSAFDPVWMDWLDLRNMVLTASTVAQAALERTESRGAHQREDYPGLDEGWRLHLRARLHSGQLELDRVPVLA